ncbi:hypothetical protein AAF712_010965 [Marasmius tenuissimus]|uniref:Methyltransferase domain-containing protein n=1 Tax=Marasmius tenuissimus TaxID=585030 RepID=A0ABR2ZMJ7_9AGAR
MPLVPVWSRHPKYAVVVLVTLACSLYLLYPFELGSKTSPKTLRQADGFPYDRDLQGRLKQSDAIYEKMLQDRKRLIKHFGPKPSDIAMFPPNIRPWPPYTVWDFFPAAYNCPHDIQRLGALGDGGKWVCGITRLETKRDCVVYSFGINYESSFEAEILRNTQHCQIWGYDFSVKSFGPEIPRNKRQRTHFYPYKLGGSDQEAVGGEPPMYTLGSLMRLNRTLGPGLQKCQMTEILFTGHQHIDILKVDIESWEFDLLTTLIKSYRDAGLPLPFGQLQLEVHAWNKSFEEYLKWWEMLEEAGLRPFWTEPNLVYNNYNREGGADLAEYSFLNVKGDNIFIRDPPRHADDERQYTRD